MQRGYSEVYGARAIARVVRTDVLVPLAQKLLGGTISGGDIVRVRVVRDELVVEEDHAPDLTKVRPDSEVKPAG